MNVMPFWAAADLVTSSEVALPFKISLEDMASGTGRLVDGELSSYAGDGVRFRAGDVLFGKLRPYLAKYWLADREGTAGGDIHVYRPAPGIEPRFLRYVVATSNFVRFAEAASKGTKMPRVEWAGLRTFPVMRVPLRAQQRIAGFLDRETAEIDAMDAELDRLVETLDSRRGAAVDQHLLGHDRQVALAWATASINTGPFGTQVKQGDYQVGGVPIINPSHIRNGRVAPDERVAVGPLKAAELARHAMAEGDIVVARRGELGRCAVIRSSEEGFLCGTGSLRVIPNKDLLDADYAALVISSRGSRTQMLAYSVGATMDNLNEELLGRVRIPLPALPEQKRIVAELDEQTARIDSMIADAQRLKALLAERRTTLITDVVTGRKEV